MLSSLRCPPLSNAFAGVIAAAVLLLAAPARAMPCVSPIDCMTNFCVDGVCCDSKCDGDCQACSAVTKGGGVDGTCGLAAVGTVCKAAYCGGAALNYFGPSKCDAAGACVEPAPMSCLFNEPCKFDLCDASLGCDQVVKLDGTPCNGSMECNSGVCVPSMSASSSSSSSSSSASGAGGGSAMGAGGTGGTGGGGYPPGHPSSCGCRAAGDAPMGGAGAISAALLALLIRNGRPRGGRSGRPCEAARARSFPCRAGAR